MLTMDKVMVLMMMFSSRSWLLLVWGLITLLLYGLVALAAGDRSTGAGAAVHYVFRSIVALHSYRLKLCSVKYIVQWKTQIYGFDHYFYSLEPKVTMNNDIKTVSWPYKLNYYRKYLQNYISVLFGFTLLIYI